MDSEHGAFPPGRPPAEAPRSSGAPRHRFTRLQQRASALPPVARGLAWAAASGIVFVLLNSTMRVLTLQLDPFQTQFLRYLFGGLVMLPLILRSGVSAWMPRQIAPQFKRGLVHTLGLALWFTALPRIPLADMTAIGFTTPLFIMIGAYLFLREPMRWERWVAAGIGFAGVLIVVAPKLTGAGGFFTLVMFGSAPIFAASFLLTKGLTRYETTGVIVVWQAISVTLFSLPLALLHWRAPSAWQWAGFAVCGGLGSLGHYCVTRSFRVADISATQSMKFLDLIWATAMGWLLFSELPTLPTLIGGAVICGSTLWIAHRESRVRAQPVENVESP